MKNLFFDLKELVWIFIACLLSTVYKRLHKDIWIICEYENQARDNGYWFFNYMMKNHYRKTIYYPIDKHCSDAKRLKYDKNVIEFGSFKHHLLLFSAKKIFTSTQFQGLPYHKFFGLLINKGIVKGKYIFLNHGVARGYSSVIDPKLINYSGIIAASDFEKRIMVEENNQPSDVVYPFGFARFDTLKNAESKTKTILLMPTWRKWLYVSRFKTKNAESKSENLLLKSEYYKQYTELINNERFITFLEKNDIKLVLCLHSYAAKFRKHFNSKSKNVDILETMDYFIQDLIRQADFLITDYSSVCFDYSFMKKPMAYFQFDPTRFAKEQYAEGSLFTYKENGFGPVCTDVNQLVEYVIESYENSFEMDEKYKKRVDAFFGNQDYNHCERIFNQFK